MYLKRLLRSYQLTVWCVISLCVVTVQATDPDEQVLAQNGRSDYRVVIGKSAEPQVKAVAEDFCGYFNK